MADVLGRIKSRARTLSSVILEHFWRNVPRRSQGPLRGLMALEVPYVSVMLLSVRVECAWGRQVTFSNASQVQRSPIHLWAALFYFLFST